MVTLTSASSALKDVYLGVVSEQLNTNINPLMARIKQTTADVWGKEIIKMAPYGLNGGIGAGTETGSLPTAAGNNYVKFVLALKNLYGKIEISDKAMRVSKNNAGAFVDLLNAEMEGLVKASAFNFGRMLYGTSSGFLCGITANTGNVLTVNNLKNVAIGMVVDIVGPTGTALSGGTARRITGINKTNSTITIDGTALSNDALNDEANGTINYYLVVQGSYGNELTGLGDIFASSGNLYGLSKAIYPWLVPYSKDITVSGATQDISETAMQTAIDTLEEDADSKVDFIVCSAGVKRNYQEYLASYRSNVDIMDLAGGFKAITYNGIPVVSDRFAPANTMYLLNTKEFNLHQLCDWKWLEGDSGNVLRQIAGNPTYSATLVKYADIICDKPSGQAKIIGISES